MAQHFKDLIVRQRAMDWLGKVEGRAHFSKASFLHFLRQSGDSLAELETPTLSAERLQYTDHA